MIHIQDIKWYSYSQLVMVGSTSFGFIAEIMGTYVFTEMSLHSAMFFDMS